ncbi:hypothetical protein [Micromonospora sp. SH-82]|uniref:hypothetical protein n=1 Tax=Micromonospora sp. SH-82 TaxID=3132938 RepID=UPI003EBA5F68
MEQLEAFGVPAVTVAVVAVAIVADAGDERSYVSMAAVGQGRSHGWGSSIAFSAPTAPMPMPPISVAVRAVAADFGRLCAHARPIPVAVRAATDSGWRCFRFRCRMRRPR